MGSPPDANSPRAVGEKPPKHSAPVASNYGNDSRFLNRSVGKDLAVGKSHMRASLLVGVCLWASGCMGGTSAPAVDSVDNAIIGGTTTTGDPGVVLLFAQVPGSQSGSLCSAEV